MNKLTEQQMEELLREWYDIVQILKGNDLSTTESNIKVMFKKMKEIIDTNSLQITGPSDIDKAKIAEDITNKIKEQITSYDILKEIKAKLDRF